MDRESAAFYLFILPWLVGFLLFHAGPIIISLYYSFTQYNILTPPWFIGVQNYVDLLADSSFYKSLYNTIYYTLLAVPLGVVVPLLVAVLLNQRVTGLSIYRTIYYLPSIVPLVASAILWMWLFQPQWGLINSILRMLNINGPLWLASPEWSKPALIIMAVWASGNTVIIYLAGLQSIPRSLLEAAEIDGASRFRRFWNITLPLLTPTIFFTLVIGIINSFQVFTQAYIMTDGGPAESTLFYVLYLFRNAFVSFRMGYASAMAWILFVIILVFTVWQLYLSKHWVHYDYE